MDDGVRVKLETTGEDEVQTVKSSIRESMTFEDFLQRSSVSTRLRNALKKAISNNTLPYRTIGEYLDAGEAAPDQLLKLQNVGLTTVNELNLLVGRLRESPPVLDENAGITSQISNVRGLTFEELIQSPTVSVRLRNCITSTLKDGSFPFKTVSDYLDRRGEAELLLLKLPNLGKTTAREVQVLIDSLLEGSLPYSSEKGEQKDRRLALASQLTEKYPLVFENLLTNHEDFLNSDPLTGKQVEKSIKSLLKNPNHAEVCQRRFFGETLDSIGKDLGVTRERIRQIEKKYKQLVLDIYDEIWLRQKIKDLVEGESEPSHLPANEKLDQFHPLLQNALRKIFFPNAIRHGGLVAEERIALAEIMGFDTHIELINSTKWSVEKLVHEVRAFACELGKPDLMPMQLEMRKHGREDLRGVIQRFGGQAKVAELTGLMYQGQAVSEDGSRTYWTDQRIGDFLNEVAEKEGHPGVMPTQQACRKYAPNPKTIITILTRGGTYGTSRTWFEIAKQYGFKYSQEKQKVTLRFVKEFVRSLGDALHSLSPAEIYVLFEQQGINKTGKNSNRARSFDNLITALQSGYLPKEEINLWAAGGESQLTEALLDSNNESIEDAYESIGEKYLKQTSKFRKNNLSNAGYKEDIEQQLPAPAVLESLNSLKVASELLLQTSSDEEAVQFLIAKAAGKLWQRCFEDECSAVAEAQAHKGNFYSELARDTFLEEYTESKKLPLPVGYEFRDFEGRVCEPKLMQRLIAYKVLRDKRVVNLSGTGTGKTLSAILASRVINARFTIITCPNNTVSGWVQAIENAFPNSDIRWKTWEPQWGRTSAPRYLVLNHEMFQDRSKNALRSLIETSPIDFIVIDELHQVKQRDEKEESQRRQLLNGLITHVPDGRPKPRVLGMSATPIVNNLHEGKSLIELVSSLRHDDIGTDTTVQNCMKLYQKFTTMGFRMMPIYNTDRIPEIYPIDCTPYITELLSLGSKPHPQQVEAVLVRARWPVIKDCLRTKTVVFTDYVQGIVPFLRDAIQEAGYSVGVYTGSEKLATEIGYETALDQFKNSSLDVLIASIKTIGTGIDGLQFICNNVIFATLPWTNTDYEQCIGRFDREGFKFPNLDIHIPRTYSILGDGQEWSWCESKLSRIENKRDIAKAAVDGEIPDSTSQLTPEKATSYWMGWLKRLTEEGISEMERMEIRVPLDETDPIKTAKRKASYGDFSRINARWNSSASIITHERLQNNPEEWCYYHTRLEEIERDWQVIPRNECLRHLRENLPLGAIVGDFGCGQAHLAAELRETHTVYSFDHVAIHASVIACDMAHTTLEDSVLDAAVFSLSLMGANIRDYVLEAYRTLKPGGQIVIYHPAAENDRQLFVDGLQKLGFAVAHHGQIYKWHFVWAIKRGRQADPNSSLSFKTA